MVSLDRWIGVREGQPLDSVMRRRAVAGIALAYALTISALQAYAVALEGVSGLDASAFVTVALYAWSLLSLNRGHKLVFPGSVVVGTCLLGNLAFIAMGGGLDGYAITCVLAPAFVAGLVLGAPGAVIVGGLTIAGVWAIYLTADLAAGQALHVIYPILTSTVVATSIGFCLLFIQMTTSFLRQAQRAAVDADRSRREAVTAGEEAMRAREVAVAANRAKSEFLANMSHEIRTPMNGVLGITQVLERTELSDAQRDYLATIQRSGHALLEIINDVLDFSKIEAGQVELVEEAFDLGQTITDVRLLLETSAREKGLSLRVSLAQGMPTSYRGDAGRIRQVLINLIGNAIKFTERGGVSVRASHANGAVRIDVSDTGVGIAEEKVEAVFDAFAQADAATTRRFGGTGLGLSISRKLARLMGGDLTARSQPGRGSTFTFTAELDVVTIPVEAARQATCELAVARPRRLLVVDDNPVNLLVVQGLLAGSGCSVTTAEDGQQGVRAFADACGSEGFDLVLMDISMPVMDGEAAARQIRSIEAERALPRTPVIALTAHVGGEIHERAAAAGMDGVLSKPVQRAQLFDAINRSPSPSASRLAPAAASAPA